MVKPLRELSEISTFFEEISSSAQICMEVLSQLAWDKKEEVGRHDRSQVRYSLGEARKLPFLSTLQRVIRTMENEGMVFERDESNLTRPYQLSIGDIRKIYARMGEQSHYQRYGESATVVGVINLKGGVSKSTSAANISTGLLHVKSLVHHQLRVCVLDLDPQGSLSYNLGIDAIPGQSAFQAILDEPDADTLRSWIQPTFNDGLHVLPASTADAFSVLRFQEIAAHRGVPASQLLEQTVLGHIMDDYDVILLDSGPHLDTMLLNVLAASHGLLVPVCCDFLDLDSSLKFLRGLHQLVMINHDCRLQPELFKILLTRHDARNSLHEEAKALLESQFPGAMFINSIPLAKPFVMSQSRRESIYDIPMKSYYGDKASLSKAIKLMDQVVEEFYRTYLNPGRR